MKQVLLRCFGTEHLVKLKLPLPSRGFHSDRVIIDFVHNDGSTLRNLGSAHWSNSTKHSDFT